MNKEHTLRKTKNIYYDGFDKKIIEYICDCGIIYRHYENFEPICVVDNPKEYHKRIDNAIRKTFI